jgi:hypothetical protein
MLNLSSRGTFSIGILRKPCIPQAVHRRDEVMNSQSLMLIWPTGRARSKQSKGRWTPMKTTNKKGSKRRLKLQDKHASAGVVEVLQAVQIARICVCVFPPIPCLLSFIFRITASRELVGMLGNASDTSDKDIPKSLVDTYHDRETTLRKLMDRNNVYNPDKRSTSSTSRPDSASLASLIGGRATGPRLNRHAPQADAHDPTQYIQPDLSAPHPIFGTGGVALPGKTVERGKNPASLVGSEMSERYRPLSSSALKPDFSAAKNEVGKHDDPAKQEKAANRRSFTTLAQRYTDNLDKAILDTTTKGTQPLMIKRKSNGSIPKEAPLPSPTKGDVTSTISMSPSKSANYLSQSSWKPSQSTPNPAPSYLTTKSPSSFPAPSTAKTSSNTYEGLSTSTSNNSVHKSTSHDRSSTMPIPTYSLPRNDVSSSNHGGTPLRRLMEKNNVYNPDKVSTDNFGKSVAERVQTTSLAAFMGGSGKGIRLNKHAPQADAHDPTQFIQPDLSTPHPIFGKGGVAMPGMVPQMRVSTLDSVIDTTGLSKPSFTKKAIWPPVSAPSKTEERPVSPQKTGGRVRTISAPRPESSSSYGVSRSSLPTLERSRSPVKGALVGVPLRDRTISTPPITTPQQSIVTPALARPIQPDVTKIPSFSPQVPATTASPAFNKPTAQKDITPSLSRLQGRGFVQNMVMASSQISNTPSPSPSPSRPASTTGKKGSVLDRWQPNVQSEPPTKSSPPFLSKNGTTRPSTYSGGGSYGLKSSASFSSLIKPAPVSPSPPKQVEASYPRSRTPGLGSATTLVVMKPSKSFTDLTELGMKTTTDSESSSSRKTPIYVR